MANLYQYLFDYRNGRLEFPDEYDRVVIPVTGSHLTGNLYPVCPAGFSLKKQYPQMWQRLAGLVTRVAKPGMVLEHPNSRVSIALIGDNFREWEMPETEFRPAHLLEGPDMEYFCEAVESLTDETERIAVDTPPLNVAWDWWSERDFRFMSANTSEHIDFIRGLVGGKAQGSVPNTLSGIIIEEQDPEVAELSSAVTVRRPIGFCQAITPSGRMCGKKVGPKAHVCQKHLDQDPMPLPIYHKYVAAAAMSPVLGRYGHDMELSFDERADRFVRDDMIPWDVSLETASGYSGERLFADS